MSSIAINDMLDSGQLQPINTGNIADFLAGKSLGVLFFAGGKKQRSDAHDVAVALREILKDYPGQVRAGLVSEDASAELQPQFRVLVAPSLVLLHSGETLEVIPRVRDWADYSRAFQRYLGNPGQQHVEAN